jgi:hypothetical protein
MAKTLPPMMHVLRDIADVELPDYVAKIAAADAPPPAGNKPAATAAVVAGAEAAAVVPVRSETIA